MTLESTLVTYGNLCQLFKISKYSTYVLVCGEISMTSQMITEVGMETFNTSVSLNSMKASYFLKALICFTLFVLFVLQIAENGAHYWCLILNSYV